MNAAAQSHGQFPAEMIQGVALKDEAKLITHEK